MPDEEVDKLLKIILAEVKSSSGATFDAKRASGKILKEFFARVDKALVDGQVVKKRLDALLSG